jgi:hypothetical protein
MGRRLILIDIDRAVNGPAPKMRRRIRRLPTASLVLDFSAPAPSVIDGNAAPE